MKLSLDLSDIPIVIHAIALAAVVLLVAVLYLSIDDTLPPSRPVTPRELREFRASIGRETNREAANSISQRSIAK